MQECFPQTCHRLQDMLPQSLNQIAYDHGIVPEYLRAAERKYAYAHTDRFPRPVAESDCALLFDPPAVVAWWTAYVARLR